MHHLLSSTLIFLATSAWTTTAVHGLPSGHFSPRQLQPQVAAFSFIDPDLVPSYGVVANTNANVKQIGSCDGFNINDQSLILIPCFCPPDRTRFLTLLDSAVGQGSFLGEPIPAFSNDVEDTSVETNKARATAMIIVLQSFNGTKGVGCPAASAPNFLSQQLTGVRIEATFVA